MLRLTPWKPRSLRGSESRFARSPLPVGRRLAPCLLILCALVDRPLLSNRLLPRVADFLPCVADYLPRGPRFPRLGAGDGIRTRDVQLGRLELYQLSYTRPVTARCSGLQKVFLDVSGDQLVGREGFEPSKAEGRQIYSLMRLTASLPPPPCRRPKRSATETRGAFPRRCPEAELAEGIEPPTR